MAGEKLRGYDLQLCDYALGNVRQYLREKRFAHAARRYFSAPMFQYLVDDLRPEVEQERLPLNDREFDELARACEGDPPELDREWVASEPLHRRRIECVREVRDELTRQDAEDWSRACAGFAERLEGKRVRLGEGIDVVHEWVRYLRRLLRAMGAAHLLPYPEGRSPTPTNPAPPTSPPTAAPPSASAPVDPQAAALARMRELIAEHGPDAEAKRLIKKADMRHKRARDALRTLEALGEYRGYSRKRPRRYGNVPPGRE